MSDREDDFPDALDEREREFRRIIRRLSPDALDRVLEVAREMMGEREVPAEVAA